MTIHRPNFDSYYEPPSYDDYPCEVCGLNPDACICPECPVCSTFGDLSCYYEGDAGHGLIRSSLQIHTHTRYLVQTAWDDYLEGIWWDSAYIEEFIGPQHIRAYTHPTEIECLISIAEACPPSLHFIPRRLPLCE